MKSLSGVGSQNQRVKCESVNIYIHVLYFSRFKKIYTLLYACISFSKYFKTRNSYRRCNKEDVKIHMKFFLFKITLRAWTVSSNWSKMEELMQSQVVHSSCVLCVPKFIKQGFLPILSLGFCQELRHPLLAQVVPLCFTVTHGDPFLVSCDHCVMSTNCLFLPSNHFLTSACEVCSVRQPLPSNYLPAYVLSSGWGHFPGTQSCYLLSAIGTRVS